MNYKIYSLADFAHLIRSLPESALGRDKLPLELRLEEDDRLAVYYAPFDYVNEAARLCLVGITPGMQQARLALHRARTSLREGLSVAEAARMAKEEASFGGQMRANLMAMLDHFRVPALIGAPDAAALFGSHRHLVHYTSVLRYPVFYDDANYNGSPDPVKHPLLRRYLEAYLVPELERPRNAVLVPLGPKVARVLAWAVEQGWLDDARVLDGLPHPSGANMERINFMLGRESSKPLSQKTNRIKLEQARRRLLRKLAYLSGA